MTLNIREYRRLPRKLEFFDLRELAKSVNKSLWPEFQALFVNKETFLGKFDQLAELRNGIRHSRTIDAIVHMEGEAGILWFGMSSARKNDGLRPGGMSRLPAPC